MGTPWYKNTSGVWVPASPLARTSSGFARANKAYRKSDATTWGQFYTRETTVPSAPVITFFGYDPESKKLKITVKAPADSDVRTVRVKIWGYPDTVVGKSADTNDYAYYTARDGDDVAWSEWTISPGEERTKIFPPEGSPQNGLWYEAGAWTIDASRNVSANDIETAQYKLPTKASSRIVQKYIMPIDTRTWVRDRSTYNSDRFLRTGWGDDHGIVYYGNRIEAALSNAKVVRNMQVNMIRYRSSEYDSPTTYYDQFAHDAPSYNGRNFNRHIIDERLDWYQYVQDGGVDSCQVKDYWYDDFKSGRFKGWGIHTQRTAGPSSEFAGMYYGYGTTGGRMYLEFEV